MFKKRCSSTFHICKNTLSKVPAQEFITDTVGVSWFSANRVKCLPIISKGIRGKICDFISILFFVHVSHNSNHTIIVLKILTSGLMENK